ncbi:MAG: hypothetical protein JO104_08470, partial [Candidatus Eremiobacteraeota bacterium]|nr:hypothetical protein [Candidatus Eremiobacteraeota bacterium]
MRVAIALAVAATLLAGCSAPSPGPRGWQPMPRASGAWSSGSGAGAQYYRYSKAQFSGGLQDLSSQITIDTLMRHEGARLRGSVVPFGPCPGAAGVATFALPDHATLEEGFAVHNGQAI